MRNNTTPSARTYQRPAWLTLVALGLIIGPVIVFIGLMLTGYGAFDGRGILILLVFGSGLAILGTGAGEAR